MAKAKVSWRFKYVGATPASTGLDEIVRGKHGKHLNPEEPGVLYPNDEVVVGDSGVAEWLRSLTDFQEVNSPTTDKPTHKKRAPAKKVPAKTGS